MNPVHRTKTIGFLTTSVLSVSLCLSGCKPAVTPEPTPTIGTASAAAPTTAPTVRPTPAPENLADAKDLPVWIDDYVHAYGGTVTVNGAVKDSDQLLGAVRADPGGFTERKTIQGNDALFLVVNGVPLAIQTDDVWRAVLARDIADAKNAQFAMPLLWYQIYNEKFVGAFKNANVATITRDLDTGVVCKDWTSDDWKNLLREWETIKPQLDAGKIPGGFAYNWKDADQIIQFARENRMGLRAQHLVWNGDVPDPIYNGGFSKADLLKILEFTVSIKVMKYKGIISEWNAADELVITEYSTDKWGFWSKHVGLLDATRLSAGLIRKIDPHATITFADDFELEERFYNAQPDLGIRLLKWVKILKQEGLIDKVDIENNRWVYDMPDLEYIENYLRQIQALGIGLSAPEITVWNTKDFPIMPGTRQAYSVVDDPLVAHAEAFRRVVQAYIDVGVYDIGLGDVGDETSAANLFRPGANIALFDTQWKPKMGWYEILKVMYEGFVK
jgi:GH35 family endo-1,4-beta-xylanase